MLETQHRDHFLASRPVSGCLRDFEVRVKQVFTKRTGLSLSLSLWRDDQYIRFKINTSIRKENSYISRHERRRRKRFSRVLIRSRSKTSNTPDRNLPHTPSGRFFDIPSRSVLIPRTVFHAVFFHILATHKKDSCSLAFLFLCPLYPHRR